MSKKEYGKLTAEEIKKLEKEHGTIFTIDVDFEEGEETVVLFGYLKKPSRSTIGMALGIIDRDPLKAKEIILEKSWVAGDERIKKDDEACLSATTVLDEFLIVRRAGLKKN